MRNAPARPVIPPIAAQSVAERAAGIREVLEIRARQNAEREERFRVVEPSFEEGWTDRVMGLVEELAAAAENCPLRQRERIYFELSKWASELDFSLSRKGLKVLVRRKRRK